MPIIGGQVNILQLMHVRRRGNFPSFSGGRERSAPLENYYCGNRLVGLLIACVGWRAGVVAVGAIARNGARPLGRGRPTR